MNGNTSSIKKESQLSNLNGSQSVQGRSVFSKASENSKITENEQSFIGQGPKNMSQFSEKGVDFNVTSRVLMNQNEKEFIYNSNDQSEKVRKLSGNQGTPSSSVVVQASQAHDEAIPEFNKALKMVENFHTLRNILTLNKPIIRGSFITVNNNGVHELKAGLENEIPIPENITSSHDSLINYHNKERKKLEKSKKLVENLEHIHNTELQQIEKIDFKVLKNQVPIEFNMDMSSVIRGLAIQQTKDLRHSNVFRPEDNIGQEIPYKMVNSEIINPEAVNGAQNKKSSQISVKGQSQIQNYENFEIKEAPKNEQSKISQAKKELGDDTLKSLEVESQIIGESIAELDERLKNKNKITNSLLHLDRKMNTPAGKTLDYSKIFTDTNHEVHVKIEDQNLGSTGLSRFTHTENDEEYNNRSASPIFRVDLSRGSLHKSQSNILRNLSPMTSRRDPPLMNTTYFQKSNMSYKVPNKYKDVKGHYGGSNLSNYLNKSKMDDHEDNKKYLQEKKVAVQDYSATSRHRWGLTQKPPKNVYFNDNHSRILDESLGQLQRSLLMCENIGDGDMAFDTSAGMSLGIHESIGKQLRQITNGISSPRDLKKNSQRDNYYEDESERAYQISKDRELKLKLQELELLKQNLPKRK